MFTFTLPPTPHSYTLLIHSIYILYDLNFEVDFSRSSCRLDSLTVSEYTIHVNSNIRNDNSQNLIRMLFFKSSPAGYARLMRPKFLTDCRLKLNISPVALEMYYVEDQIKYVPRLSFMMYNLVLKYEDNINTILISNRISYFLHNFIPTICFAYFILHCHACICFSRQSHPLDESHDKPSY
jgi:hypothetical protein